MKDVEEMKDSLIKKITVDGGLWCQKLAEAVKTCSEVSELIDKVKIYSTGLIRLKKLNSRLLLDVFPEDILRGHHVFLAGDVHAEEDVYLFGEAHLASLREGSVAYLFEQASGEAKTGEMYLYGESTAELSGQAGAWAYDHAVIHLRDHASADLFNHARAYACDESKVSLKGCSSAELKGNAICWGYDESSVVLMDNASAVLGDHSRFVASGNADVECYDFAFGTAEGNVHCYMEDLSHVTVKEGSNVRVESCGDTAQPREIIE